MLDRHMRMGKTGWGWAELGLGGRHLLDQMLVAGMGRKNIEKIINISLLLKICSSSS